MYQKGFIFRLIGVVILIGLLIGAGTMSFRAGYAQGLTQAPEVAQAISNAVENGQAVPYPPMIGQGFAYSHHFGFGFPHPVGFFPIGALFGILIFLFFFFGLMRMIFFRPWHMGWGYHGPHHHGHHGCPPWMKDEGGDPEAHEKKEEAPTEKK